MKIGKYLRMVRLIENKSIRDSAKEIGILSSTLSRIENSKQGDGVTILKLISFLFSK